MLNNRKSFYTRGVIKVWNRLLSEVVEPPSLAVFKSCLDTMLKDMV